MQKIHLIIPAAGESSRMGSATPKQFSNFHGKTILEFVESIFSNLASISSITIALNKNQKFIENLGCQFSQKTSLINCGGSSRSETVLNALEIIEENIDTKDWIMVHDAARLGINESLINNFIREVVSDKVGGILAIPALDTVKRVNEKKQIIEAKQLLLAFYAATEYKEFMSFMMSYVAELEDSDGDETEKEC